MDGESWGLSYKGSLWHNGKSRKYTEAFYDKNTVIGVLLDLNSGTVSFCRNGVSLGLAFTGLDKVRIQFYCDILKERSNVFNTLACLQALLIVTSAHETLPYPGKQASLPFSELHGP